MGSCDGLDGRLRCRRRRHAGARRRAARDWRGGCVKLEGGCGELGGAAKGWRGGCGKLEGGCGELRRAAGRLCGKLRGAIREAGDGPYTHDVGIRKFGCQCACRAVVGARAYGVSTAQHSGPAHRATGSAPGSPWRPTGGSGQCATFVQTTKNGECARRSGRGRGFGSLDHGERAGRARRARGWGGRRRQKLVVSVVTLRGAIFLSKDALSHARRAQPDAVPL